MKLGLPTVAVALSALIHLGAFGLVFALSLRASYSPPMLLETYGDSDREGFPIAAVSADPGAYKQGDQHTPGGDGADFPKPEPKPEILESSAPSAAAPPAPEEAPLASASEFLPLPAATLPEARPAPASDSTASVDKKLPGAP